MELKFAGEQKVNSKISIRFMQQKWAGNLVNVIKKNLMKYLWTIKSLIYSSINASCNTDQCNDISF